MREKPTPTPLRTCEKLVSFTTQIMQSLGFSYQLSSPFDQASEGRCQLGSLKTNPLLSGETADFLPKSQQGSCTDLCYLGTGALVSSKAAQLAASWPHATQGSCLPTIPLITQVATAALGSPYLLWLLWGLSAPTQGAGQGGTGHGEWRVSPELCKHTVQGAGACLGASVQSTWCGALTGVALTGYVVPSHRKLDSLDLDYQKYTVDDNDWIMQRLLDTTAKTQTAASEHFLAGKGNNAVNPGLYFKMDKFLTAAEIKKEFIFPGRMCPPLPTSATCSLKQETRHLDLEGAKARPLKSPSDNGRVTWTQILPQFIHIYNGNSQFMQVMWSSVPDPHVCWITMAPIGFHSTFKNEALVNLLVSIKTFKTL